MNFTAKQQKKPGVTDLKPWCVDSWLVGGMLVRGTSFWDEYYSLRWYSTPARWRCAVGTRPAVPTSWSVCLTTVHKHYIIHGLLLDPAHFHVVQCNLKEGFYFCGGRGNNWNSSPWRNLDLNGQKPRCCGQSRSLPALIDSGFVAVPHFPMAMMYLLGETPAGFSTTEQPSGTMWIVVGYRPLESATYKGSKPWSNRMLHLWLWLLCLFPIPGHAEYPGMHSAFWPHSLRPAPAVGETQSLCSKPNLRPPFSSVTSWKSTANGDNCFWSCERNYLIHKDSEHLVAQFLVLDFGSPVGFCYFAAFEKGAK